MIFFPGRIQIIIIFTIKTIETKAKHNTNFIVIMIKKKKKNTSNIFLTSFVPLQENVVRRQLEGADQKLGRDCEKRPRFDYTNFPDRDPG